MIICFLDTIRFWQSIDNALIYNLRRLNIRQYTTNKQNKEKI